MSYTITRKLLPNTSCTRKKYLYEQYEQNVHKHVELLLPALHPNVLFDGARVQRDHNDAAAISRQPFAQFERE